MSATPELVCEYCRLPESECAAVRDGNSITLVDPSAPSTWDENDDDDDDDDERAAADRSYQRAEADRSYQRADDYLRSDERTAMIADITGD